MFEAIQHAIRDFMNERKITRDQMIIVMGEDFYKQLKNEFPLTQATEPKTIFGVQIVRRDRIKGEQFGIMPKSCLGHVDDHIDEMMAEFEDGPEWIQCDLCGHPLNVNLADGDDLKCLWCGDVNDLEDIAEGEY